MVVLVFNGCACYAVGSLLEPRVQLISYFWVGTSAVAIFGTAPVWDGLSDLPWGRPVGHP